jgi:hypothetical protein
MKMHMVIEDDVTSKDMQISPSAVGISMDFP